MDILLKLFSFVIGLILSYSIFVFINRRNCIILSSNLSTKILNEKIYNKKKQKCYTFSKKNKEKNNQ